MSTQSKKYTNILYIVLLIISIIYMLIKPYVVINSIKETINAFVFTILPTLFPFILCSQMIIMLNGARLIGYPLSIVTKILKLDRTVSGAYAASLIGGYPSGAASLNLLYSKGQLKDKYLASMLLCSNCGPMFLVGTVGTIMLGSYTAGIIILISHIIGGIINAFIFSKLDLEEEGSTCKNTYSNAVTNSDIFKVLDKCILNTSKIMIKIFAFMGLFKLIGDAIFLNADTVVESVSAAEVLFRGSLEIMDGCINAASLELYMAAAVICMIVSFGGLSAVFQSISVAKEIPFNKQLFIIGKITHGILSSLLCIVLIRIVPLSVEVYAWQGESIESVGSASVNYVLSLVFVCCLYMIFRAYVKRKYIN